MLEKDTISATNLKRKKNIQTCIRLVERCRVQEDNLVCTSTELETTAQQNQYILVLQFRDPEMFCSYSLLPTTNAREHRL